MDHCLSLVACHATAIDAIEQFSFKNFHGSLLHTVSATTSCVPYFVGGSWEFHGLERGGGVKGGLCRAVLCRGWGGGVEALCHEMREARGIINLYLQPKVSYLWCNGFLFRFPFIGMRKGKKGRGLMGQWCKWC